MSVRVGLGHDTHRLALGRPLILGGVRIPHERGPVGHSDADVLLHAVTDALLGAAALPDIGELFPDTDPANADLDSGLMLREAHRQLEAAGWQVVNVDCVVLAERPKLSGYKSAIRQRIAELLGLPPECVGVKAKTGEGVGEVGRGEVIVAQSVVLIETTSRPTSRSWEEDF